MTDSQPHPHQRIAVIGGGISGLIVAHLLRRDHDITVFEAADYVGGHTNTIEVDDRSGPLPVDTGFIVFNEHNYPNFTRMLADLGGESQPTRMGFSVTAPCRGLEYSGRSMAALFSQRRNLFRPAFLRMLRDIRRFYREAPELLQGDDRSTTLGEYVSRKGFSREFIEDHLIPFGAAIWSAAPDDMYAFPAQYFVRFFDNHGFLQLRKPPWRVIRGGSYSYVKALTKAFADRIRLSCPVRSVRRLPGGVEVSLQHGESERFDSVVLAVHSDQALRMLADPRPEESAILGDIEYQTNDCVLHTDERLLPSSQRAWSSWNYRVPDQPQQRVSVTYNMNLLQSLASDDTYCVTLNGNGSVAGDRVIAEMTYHHPRYTLASLSAQSRHAEISGVSDTYYCGAYWGFGFHEDGVNSAIAVAAQFGKSAG